MRSILIAALILLAGCAPPPPPRPAPHGGGAARPAVAATPAPPRVPAETAARNFVSVVERVTPVAAQVCRERTRGDNCGFRILVDDRAGQPPNAYQTLDRAGRPVLVFTLALIGEARNADELAFVMGHEAGHHIAGHIPRLQQSAASGAILGAVLGAALGGAEGVRAGQSLGATVGGRVYSKEFELEADALGTVIAHRAGYNPLRGAEFFTRIPDPGNRFLGSHPPNAARIQTVRRTAAQLR